MALKDLPDPRELSEGLDLLLCYRTVDADELLAHHAIPHGGVSDIVHLLAARTELTVVGFLAHGSPLD